MIFQQGESSFYITIICLCAIGAIFLFSYVLFAYIVTHKGDFYQIRRWKGAILFAGIFSLIFTIILLFVIIISLDTNSSAKYLVELFRLIFGLLLKECIFEVIMLIFSILFTYLTLIIPFQFMVTLGIHFQLKRWYPSDDYLDKIWEDPNKGHRSPIRDV